MCVRAYAHVCCLSFSLTWDPMEVNFQNATPGTVMILFQPNFFLMFPVTVPTKVADINIESSNLKFFKKD